MNGNIFQIQRFCVNDGPGIRTTVFLKGCPLSCIWCHNPESNSVKPEIFYDAKKCIGCGACAAVCPKGCHIVDGGEHIYRRENCIACGACAAECFMGGLELVGKKTSVQEVLQEVRRDQPFYEKSGGGLTISGGEPMMQPDFVRELLLAAKEEGLHVCMETCGYGSPEQYKRIAPLVDLFLFDYKVTDPEDHRKFTGVDNRLILANLRMLNEMGRSIVLRCPIIPGCNDKEGHFAGIAAMAEELEQVQYVDIEPYHPLGSSKSEMLGRDYALKGLSFPEGEKITEWIETIQKRTGKRVKRA